MNTSLQSILAKKLAKGNKVNGFTLVELMVVIVIVGILTAVGLPELTKAQNKAKSSAAKALVVNASKNCATDLLFGDTAGALPSGVTGKCEASDALAATAGGEIWTVTFDANGIPGVPAQS
jgi:type IV pilus assembly protein PilA